MTPSVLIVDDSLTVRMDLDEAFVSAGFRTVLCADLSGARRSLSLERFDLAVLDVLLPDGGGLDLLRDLRRQPATALLPVIVLSTEAEVSDRIRGLRIGASDYVGKPYDRGYLVSRARELVRRSGGEHVGDGALVLVVDDSATVRNQLRETLEANGLAVVEAASGEEGLRVAFDRRPAAAIIDGQLPGIDGAEVVRQLRGDAILRRMPCILLTAVEERVSELRALEEGADAYLRKEEGLDLILTRLRALMRSGAQAPVVDSPNLLGPKRIVVIGERDAELEELASHLRRDGHEAVLARSLADAVQLLGLQPADCILVDLAGAGLEACLILKADLSLRTIPLILLTDPEAPAAVVEGLEAGADDAVPRTSDPELVRARLRAQLRRTQFRHEDRFLAARERFERAAEVLETIPDAFCAVDSQWLFVYANGNALELLERAREEVLGASLWTALGPIAGPEVEARLRQAVASGEPCLLETRLCRPGAPWYEVRAFPNERGLVLYLRDVSERKRAEAALRESEDRYRVVADELREADERKNQFIAVLSHELRNPLSPIQHGLHILEHVAPGSEQAEQAQRIMYRQVGHMSRLIEDLLDVTRIQRGKVQLRREILELAELLRRTVDDHRSLFAGDRASLHLSVSDEPLWIDGDPTRLAQVIGNLLQNAAKFSARGETVSVVLRREQELAVLRVRDTGAGINRETLSRIFEPFTQADRTLDRSKGGLGLGLALVKGLVELHGGEVAASSEGPGTGAEFAIRLPLSSPPTTQARLEPGARPHHPRRILLIEDNVDAAESLREVLELGQHQVEVAYTGPEGIARARELHPEVVLCDIGLPGMDGYEVAQVFRADQELRGAFLIALSGYALPEDVQRASAAGFARHIAKPASIERLEEIFASIGAPR